MRSPRGMVVQDVLRNNGLLSFADIKDEVNRIYAGGDSRDKHSMKSHSFSSM
jgi:hypothetical protein